MADALQLDLLTPRWVPPSTKMPAPAPWRDPFLEHHAETLRVAGERPLVFDAETWDYAARTATGIDVEVYVNFFVACFKRFKDSKRIAFELSPRCPLDANGLRNAIESNLTISFNGRTYDLLMIYLALAGADTVHLKAASDQIIRGELRPWEAERTLGLRVPRLNHIDLLEPNPSVRQGLKIIHGRLHGRFMVDLPYHPEAQLTPEGMNITTLYCFNDIDATEGLYTAMREPMELRVALGKQYDMDLRSRSDAQIGEAIIKRRVEALAGRRLDKAGAAPPGSGFPYEPPSFIAFAGQTLNRVLDRLREARFTVNGTGKVEAPKALEGLTLTIGGSSYTMGIGGLHSNEAHRGLKSNEHNQLIDVDVASQYPNIILKLGLYPAGVGPKFLEIYGRLVKERLAAKAAGDKVRADGGRITVNGVYGKLGSPYSVLYGPHLLIATTLTGQLSILMLIERAELAGIPVVSANTDGVVFYCPRQKIGELERLLADWQAATGFELERTPYRAIYNASVNTYLALKEDGKIKRKGTIADPWAEGDLRGQIMKNPQMTICSKAVLKYVEGGVPLQETIMASHDVREFVTVVKVTGGALWRGHPLGRAVRYYWSLDGDQIYYADGSRKVSKTNGAKPLLELTEKFLEDIDYLRYYEEAVRLAGDLGITL